MLYHPELIVYLWLVPVFLTIIIPLVAAPLVVMGERLFAARDESPDALYSTQNLDQTDSDEDRVYTKLTQEGITAYISDGTNSCSGSVTDVSKHGICLINPSDVIDREAERLGVHLTLKGKSFPMEVRPEWQHDSGRQENIGAKIIEGSWNWDEFKKCAEAGGIRASSRMI